LSRSICGGEGASGRRKNSSFPAEAPGRGGARGRRRLSPCASRRGERLRWSCRERRFARGQQSALGGQSPSNPMEAAPGRPPSVVALSSRAPGLSPASPRGARIKRQVQAPSLRLGDKAHRLSLRRARAASSPALPTTRPAASKNCSPTTGKPPSQATDSSPTTRQPSTAAPPGLAPKKATPLRAKAVGGTDTSGRDACPVQTPS
jgi:hypothetical protein